MKESSLRKLITARHSLAKLTGFESYAHRSQKNSLLGSYENAHDFLWGLIQVRKEEKETNKRGNIRAIVSVGIFHNQFLFRES